MKEEIKEEIKCIVAMEANGIALIDWEKIIKNIHNGDRQQLSEFSNNMKLEDWKELFEEYSINLSINQLKLVFDYLCRFYPNDVSKMNGKYSVIKRFRPKLEILQLVFYTIETYKTRLEVNNQQ